MEQIILRPIETPRKNWAEQFEKTHLERNDKMLMNDAFNDEILDEWN